MGTAKDKEEVREMVKKLHVLSPGVYFTFDHSTGIKRTIKPEEFGGDGACHSGKRRRMWAEKEGGAAFRSVIVRLG